MDEQIWGALYDAERLNRYYQSLANRYRKLHFWFNIAIAFGSLFAALTFFAELPKLVSAVLFCLVSAGVIWVTFANYARKAASAETASVQIGQAKTALARLWRRIDSSFDEAVYLDQIERQIQNATALVSIDVDNELNLRCAQVANEHLEAEFAR